jgi:hypothetical protein
MNYDIFANIKTAKIGKGCAVRIVFKNFMGIIKIFVKDFVI